MSLEDRVSTLEVDMDEVRTLLASAARHAENATAVAERTAIAIEDSRQDRQLQEARLTRLDEQLAEHVANSEATRQRLEEYSANQETTRQRLDSFIFDAQRLLNNQGDRLSRVEASLETLVSMAQNHERRITAREDRSLQNDERFSQIDERLERVSPNMAAVADGLRTLEAGLNRLEAIQENHLRREHGQGEED